MGQLNFNPQALGKRAFILGSMAMVSSVGTVSLSATQDLPASVDGVLNHAQLGMLYSLQVGVNKKVRVQNAREVLGRQYNKSVVRHSESVEEIRQFLLTQVKRGLPKKFQAKALEVTTAILRESEKHGFDPLFVAAVIQNESAFNPLARGPVGEIGLMQIRPTTAAWLSKKMDLKYRGPRHLENTQFNIQLGTAYLAQLRESFRSDGGLYLAAFNMGSSNVKQALAKNIRPKDYANRVLRRYLRLYQDLKQDTQAPARGLAKVPAAA